MPGILYEPISKRNFLKKTIAAGVGLSLASPLSTLARSEKKEIYWAFLSDIHISEDEQNEYRNFFPFKNLKSIVPKVVDTNPEGIIINGDIARLTGEVGDYNQVKTLLKPLAAKAPVYMTLGNHDERENFYKLIENASEKDQSVEDKHVVVLDAGPVRMVLLDSLMYVNKTPGFLGETQRNWLQDFLKKSDDTPTLIFVHHTLGSKDSDLLDVERMFEILKPHKKVKAVIYGHSHTYRFDKRDAIHLINLPAVGYNFSDDEPVGWVGAKIRENGADFTLHTFGGNQSKNGEVTQVNW